MESKGCKRKAYSVTEKLCIIDRVHKGEARSKVCNELKIAESTFRGWLKDEQKLRDYLHDVDSDEGIKRKRARTANDNELDDAVYAWFTQQREQGVPISGTILKAQAKKMAKSMDNESHFRASHGWLWRFQRRHGIKQNSLSGEIRSANQEAASNYPNQLREIIIREQYTEGQIYNCDEAGLCYRMMPDKTLATRDDPNKKEGFKKNKERLTLLFCVNKTGTHKMKPLCIGKYNSPRCFHHMNMENLPFVYRNSGNAWITSTIFTEWFFKMFVPAVRNHQRSRGLEEKALLLLDNCPAHPPADALVTSDGKIRVEYLPKNTTSIIQPLDQGIISTFKQNYRRLLIQSMLDSGEGVTTFLNSVNLKEVVFMGGQAWKAVTPKNIEGCWIKGLGAAFDIKQICDRDSDDDSNFEGFSETDVINAEAVWEKFVQTHGTEMGVSLDDMEEWIFADNDCPTAEYMSDEQIINSIRNKCAAADDSTSVESDADANVAPPPPSAEEAIKSFDIAIRWLETQNVDYVKIMQVRNLRDFALRQRNQRVTQKKLTDFFKM